MASVGTVFYDVLPNLDGFAAKVAAGVGKQKPVKVKVEADTKSAETSAKRLTSIQTKEAQQSSAKRMALMQRDAIAENRYRDRNIAATKRASAQRMALMQRDAIAENRLRDRALASQQKAAARAAALQRGDRAGAVKSGGTAALVGGAATLYALKQVVDVTAEFDSAVSNVASTGKEASASIGQLREQAIKYGAATAFSATEAANAQAELIKANVSVTDTINGGLKGALDLAAAGSLGVADAAGIMGTTLSQFKLPGTDASHVADLLAAAAGKAQGEVTDFAEALKYVGPLASSAGVSLEETTGVLAEFANQGILGSQAGTALRGIFLGLTAPVGAGAKAIEKYGINVRDAQGNFIGLEGAAGELQKRLGGLTRAQRDAALAAIFGRNQVTAATILYEEGAAGVQKWSDAVSESGFAARTAATKMDNLKGDVEQLKGALDSAFIQSGSGGTSFLRGLAQDATETIDSFNSLNPAVQQFAFKAAAIAGASLLAGGALIKLTAGVTSATGGLVALGAIAPATAAKIGTLTAALGPAAAAFVALTAGAALLNSLEPAVKRVDELSKSLGEIAAGQGNLNDVFAGSNWAGDLMAALNGGVTPAKDLQSALRGLEITQGTFGGQVAKWREKFTPGTQAIERASEEVGNLDKALVGMVASGQTEQAATAVQKAAQFLPEYSKALNEAAGAGGAAASSLRASEIAFKNGGSGVGAMGEAAGYTADELATMNAEIYAAANAALQLSGGAIAVEAAMDSAAAAAKKNGENLNISTDAGRANQTELDRLVATTNQQTAAMNDQNKGIGSIAALNEKAKKSWIDTAVAMGKNRDKAKELADELFVLPTEVTSQIVVSGAKVSAREAKSLNRELKGIPKEQRARIVTIANTKGAKEARIEIAKVKSKSVIAKATGKGVNTVKEIDGALKKLKSKGVRAEAKAAGKPAVNALDNAIKDLKSRKVSVSASASGKGAVDALRGSINSVQSKTVTVRVVTRKSTAGGVTKADGGTLGLPGHYGGGTVRGVGGPREDNIAALDRATGQQIAWVSATEEVVNARSSALNRDIIKQINANPGQRFGLVGLAGGGTIDGKAAKAATSSGSRPLILNIDMGDLGVRRIVTEIVEGRDEYAASIGRMH
jgi:TP901 family phage tail tape measure protein